MLLYRTTWRNRRRLTKSTALTRDEFPRSRALSLQKSSLISTTQSVAYTRDLASALLCQVTAGQTSAAEFNAWAFRGLVALLTATVTLAVGVSPGTWSTTVGEVPAAWDGSVLTCDDGGGGDVELESLTNDCI